MQTERVKPSGRGVAVIAERALPARGGLAVATSRIAKLAAERGDRVHVLHLSKDCAPGARGRQSRDGVVYHPVGRLPEDEDSLLALLCYAEDVIKSCSLDLVHGIYASRAGYVATLLAKQLGLASIVSLRGNDLDKGLLRARDLPFLQYALTHATVVTGVSSELSAKAEGLFERPVEHITNSVDSEVFKPQPRDASLAAVLSLQGRQVLGFSGELREKKGMRFLLPAFAAVCAQRAVSLLLIGGVRADAKGALEAFEKQAPEAAAHLHCVPYERDPQRLCRLLALCDLMVFPSLYEGTPNAVLEAMAAARPVLATAAGGHKDLITSGENGGLLPCRPESAPG